MHHHPFETNPALIGSRAKFSVTSFPNLKFFVRMVCDDHCQTYYQYLKIHHTLTDKTYYFKCDHGIPTKFQDHLQIQIEHKAQTLTGINDRFGCELQIYTELVDHTKRQKITIGHVSIIILQKKLDILLLISMFPPNDQQSPNEYELLLVDDINTTSCIVC